MDLELNKKQARATASAMRKPAHDALKDEAALALMAHHFPVSPKAGTSVVSGFHPYQSEIDTRPLLGKLAGEGWTTALPIVVKPSTPLIFRRWLPGEPLISGVWGIKRPPDDAPEVAPDVLLIPLLAFDRKGYRLGYGGGFYDRTLEKLRAHKAVIAIGVAYSVQEVDAVPHDHYDQFLNYVMTEKELITCG
ncbi:MAG: 5-formyltetrahydrofolate cyclo-ligase [Alphaproteobacteria bacterium]|nr:5-formyltetrahydrofolate cyclo-ligase [Alphaproteobacteria bacterium]